MVTEDGINGADKEHLISSYKTPLLDWVMYVVYGYKCLIKCKSAALMSSSFLVDDFHFPYTYGQNKGFESCHMVASAHRGVHHDLNN